VYIKLGMKRSTVAGNFLLDKPAMATVLRGTAGQFPGRYPNSGLPEYDNRDFRYTSWKLRGCEQVEIRKEPSKKCK